MEIEFKFEIEDWMAFQKNHLNSSKQFKRSKILVVLMIPFVFSIILIGDFLNGVFNTTGTFFLAIVSVFWVMAAPKWLYSRTIKLTKKMMEDGDNSGILGLHKIIFTDEGIVHIEPESEQKIKWDAIKKLEESDTHYFLYNTAVSAIVIPKLKITAFIEDVDKIVKANILLKK